MEARIAKNDLGARPRRGIAGDHRIDIIEKTLEKGIAHSLSIPPYTHTALVRSMVVIPAEICGQGPVQRRDADYIEAD
jgi:hypothetical protein